MRWIVTSCMIAIVCCGLSARAEPPNRNRHLLNLEPNKWVKIHEQKKGERVRFRRQEHGGSCFDSRRGRLVLFGSNTHGKDWTNSPLIFDLASLTWQRLYPNDEKATYKVTAEGLPVAGPRGEHPWAMHTFGGVIYDPARDEMVICCYPAHMVPGRFTNALPEIWPKVKRHPTWTFQFKQNRWLPLPCEPVHFFPYCAVYDSDRKVIVGYRPDGIYELSGEPRTWKKVISKGFFGWHTNAVYDSKHKAVVVFGSNENSNDIVVYYPATKTHKKTPTPGVRPPKDQHAPMCFDPGSGKVVIVIDRVLESAGKEKKVRAETWLYDLGTDRWRRIPQATLPFGCGMNYNMEYDPLHKVCLLVTGNARRPTTVWALRVDLGELTENP